jgi:RNA polymerase sigma factor (sigma-70 family)
MLEAREKNIHQTLIDKCRNNDRKAQCELYKLFYKPMFNTSLRILNDAAEAEDVMQESFLIAFSKLSNYSGEGSFGGWLRRIVVNNCIDALRKRQEFWPFDEQLMDLPEEPDNMHEYYDYKVEEIKKIISRLPDDQRIMLSLFLFEGFDHEEIAMILNISNNASRTRFFRAKQALIKNLEVEHKLKLFNPN